MGLQPSFSWIALELMSALSMLGTPGFTFLGTRIGGDSGVSGTNDAPTNLLGASFSLAAVQLQNPMNKKRINWIRNDFFGEDKIGFYSNSSLRYVPFGLTRINISRKFTFERIGSTSILQRLPSRQRLKQRSEWHVISWHKIRPCAGLLCIFDRFLISTGHLWKKKVQKINKFTRAYIEDMLEIIVYNR